uniref:flagellar basal body P-ring formation chaperone FlgA n=1 Tax=Halomonas sp. TaxID=1486246 RepID=UPI0026336F36|nr:flagellar basal body P-ring formation chaperone FlgA [Halomonas sp.]
MKTASQWRPDSVPKVLSTLILVFALPAIAATSPNGNAIAEQVEAFLSTHLQAEGVTSEDIDIQVFPPATHLDSCNSPAPFLPRPDQPLSGRISIGVRCKESPQNVRYLQAEVHRFGNRLVITQDIAVGERIRPEVLRQERVDLSRMPAQLLHDPINAIGLQAKRPLRKGHSLTTRDLQAPRLVDRDQTVTIEASGQGFRLQRQGKALDAGGLGDTIRVRVSQRDIIEARVAGPGILSVTF